MITALDMWPNENPSLVTFPKYNLPIFLKFLSLAAISKLGYGSCFLVPD